ALFAALWARARWDGTARLGAHENLLGIESIRSGDLPDDLEPLALDDASHGGVLRFAEGPDLSSRRELFHLAQNLAQCARLGGQSGGPEIKEDARSLGDRASLPCLRLRSIAVPSRTIAT